MKHFLLKAVLLFITLFFINGRQSIIAYETVFVKSVSSSPINLDPLTSFTSTEAQIFTAIYEGLVTYHPFSLEPVPGVARRWEIDSKGTIYRFFLRTSARYWNGDQVLAHHFKQSWLKLLDPAKEAEYASLLDVVKGAKDYRTGTNHNPDSVAIRVIDSHTLEVELNNPAPHFLQVLCLHSFTPIHPEYLVLESWDDLSTVNSNGPFIVLDHGQDELILKKNPQYWDKNSVALEKIIVKYLDDPDEVTKKINRRDIHWSDGNVNISQLIDPHLLVVNQIFSTNFFFFLSDQEPFDDHRVRRALSLLLPWDLIRSPQYMHIPTYRLVPQIHTYPEVLGIYLTNIEEAMELLAEAGFPEGEGLPEIIISIPEGLESKRVAGHMAETWKEHLSVSVSLELHHFQLYFDALKKGNYTLGTITWIGDFADPLTFLGMWTSKSTLNLANYYNTDYDLLIDRSKSQEGQKRFDTMAKAEGILLQEAVVLPIRHSPAINIIDLNAIEGWYPNPLDIHPFKYIRIIPPTAPFGTVKLPYSLIPYNNYQFTSQ